MAKEYRGHLGVINVNTKGYGLTTSADVVYIKDKRTKFRIEFMKDSKPYSIEFSYCDIKRIIKTANRKWLEEGDNDRLSD